MYHFLASPSHHAPAALASAFSSNGTARYILSFGASKLLVARTGSSPIASLFRETACISSPLAYSPPANPMQANARPIAEVSAFSRALVLFTLLSPLTSSAYPEPTVSPASLITAFITTRLPSFSIRCVVIPTPNP